MNARWQQTLVFLQLALLLAWLAWAWPQSPRWALAGLLLAWLWQLFSMGLPFVLMQAVNRAAAVPPVGLARLLRAWWREVGAARWVFGWLQPFCHRARPDCLAPTPGQRGVLLLHGYLCNRGLWQPWLRTLRAQGRAYRALTLEPAFGTIDAYASAIDAAVRELHAATGLAPLLVCHSMGGLAARAWLRACPDGAQRVHHIVTLGTPHQGTWAARFGYSTNARQMRQGSAWLQALAAAEPPAQAALFTCWYSDCDNIVFPALTATLVGAENCLLSGAGHMQLALAPQVQADTLERFL